MYPVGREVPHHFLTPHPSLIFDQSSLKGIKLLHAISQENCNWSDIWQHLTGTENQCSETPAGVLRSRTLPRRCPPTGGPRALSTTAHLHTLIKLKCQLPGMELTSSGPSFLRMKGRESRPRQLPACRGSSNPELRRPPAACCAKVRNAEWAGQGPRPLTWWCSHLPIQASRRSGRMFTCKLFLLRLSLTLCGFHTDGSVPNHGHHTLSCKTEEQEGQLWSGECPGLAAGENALKGEQAAYLTGEWDGCGSQEVGAQLLARAMFDFLVNVCSEATPCRAGIVHLKEECTEIGQWRERVCVSVCVCVCVWECSTKGFYQWSQKLNSLFFLSCFIEVSIYRKLQGFPDWSTCLPMQETWETRVWSLDWEDPLEEGMAIHSSILAWEIPWTGEPGKLQTIGSRRIRHDWSLLAYTHISKLYKLVSSDICKDVYTITILKVADWNLPTFPGIPQPFCLLLFLVISTLNVRSTLLTKC